MLPASPRYLDNSLVHHSPSRPALLSHASCGLSRPAPLSPGVILAILLATGCGGGADSGTESSPDHPWTLDGPEVRIGSLDDPDYLFGLVGSVVPGPDGLVYSLHPRDAVVRRWTADGTPAGTIGRRGEGPGEFTQPGRMGFFGDSLWVMDSRLNRASYFDLAGEFLGSASPDISLAGPNGRAVRPSYPLRDGTFVARPGAGSLQIATGELTENPLMRVDAEGNALGTIWLQPFKPLDLLALLDERGRGGMFSIQAFPDHPLSAPREAGLLVVDRAAWTGSGPATIGVTGIDWAGDTLFSRSSPYAPVPLASERVDSIVRATTERLRNYSEGDVRAATYRPSHVPPVGGIVAGRDGTIWLRHFDPARSEGGEQVYEWWVMDAEGHPLARAVTPARLRLRTILSDVVWGVERDELDVEYIVRYRLEKGD